MANSITTMTSFVPILDEVYKKGALTSILDNERMVTFNPNGKAIKIPKISLQGLGAHTRGSSYVAGDVELTFEEKTPNYDRNRKFSVDKMDDIETAGVAFGMVAGEFLRTKVIPEVDAVRLAAYYAAALAASNAATPATLSTGDAVKTALRVGQTALDNNEVPREGRVLFITQGLLDLVKDLALTTSKEILNEFEAIVTVPQSRFYTLVTLYDGTTSGQEAGGYIKTATTGANINFLIIHREAIIQAIKHQAPKYIPAEVNQSGDNDEFAYRIYGINSFLDNKVKGIYGHAQAA
jgi:hypothetical protein